MTYQNNMNTGNVMNKNNLDPDNPQIRVDGYGIINLKQVHQSIVDYLKKFHHMAELSKFEEINKLIYSNNSMFKTFIDSALSAEKELDHPDTKHRVEQKYKSMNKYVDVKPDGENLSLTEILNIIKESNDKVWKKKFPEFKTVEDFIERLKVDSFSKEEGKNPILVHDDDIILIRKKEAYFYKLTDVKKHGGFYSVGNYYKKENLY